MNNEPLAGEWKPVGAAYPEQYELPVTYKNRRFKLLIYRRGSETYKLFLTEKHILEELFQANNLEIDDLEEAKKLAIEIGIPRIKYLVDHPKEWECENLINKINNELTNTQKQINLLSSELSYIKSMLNLLTNYLPKNEEFKQLLKKVRGFNSVKKIEVKRTCDFCPSQWEGTTDNGKTAYLRYRWGKLWLGIGKNLNEAIKNQTLLYDSEDSWDGYLTDEEMIKIVKKQVGIDVEVVRIDENSKLVCIRRRKIV